MSVPQHGGTKIGEGYYGCVFAPPLKCKSRTKQPTGKMVGKLAEIDTAETEVMISSALKKLRDAKEYFILIESACEPAPAENQIDEDLKDCRLLDSVELSSTLQVSMSLGGKALTYVPWTTKDIDYQELGQHLLEAGTLMLMAGVVHSDLHTSNILLDTPSKVRIIDFGIGWRPEALTLNNLLENAIKSFNPSISQEPPELATINGLTEGQRLQQILEKLQRDKVTVTHLGILFEKTPEEMWDEFRNFLDHSWSFRERTEIAFLNFFKLYWSKIDAWSIGVILFGLFAKLIHDPAFENSLEYQTRGGIFVEVIKGLCTMDPGLRFDCAEALQMWAPESVILERPEVKEWLESATRTREALAAIL
jgi:serine/threonine protein kinase